MKGRNKKKDFDQNIALHEVFLEAVPSAFITIIGIKAGLFKGKQHTVSDDIDDDDNDDLNNDDNDVIVAGPGLSDVPDLSKIIFGKGIFSFSDGYTEFIITFSLSFFSASLGLAKCLKNGVARPIGDGGCLDGLLSARHLLALFICGICLFARAACLDCLGYVTNPSGQV